MRLYTATRSQLQSRMFFSRYSGFNVQSCPPHHLFPWMPSPEPEPDSIAITPTDATAATGSGSAGGSDPTGATEQFLHLLGQHDAALRAYVRTLVANDPAADDLLQDTRLTAWRQFHKFEPGSNFIAWTKTIALHHVLNWRRKQQRHPTALSADVLELLAHELQSLEAPAPESAAVGSRQEALQHCLGKLPAAQRTLVQLRYHDEHDIDQIAGRVGRSEGAVYRALSRIRMALMDCIEDRLNQFSNPRPGEVATS